MWAWAYARLGGDTVCAGFVSQFPKGFEAAVETKHLVMKEKKSLERK